MRNTSSKEKIARFYKELELLKDFQSKPIDNIVNIIDVKISDKVTDSYVTMEKYDGSLKDLFPYTQGNVRYTFELLYPIITALKKLSEHIPAIYHRNLKPDNILYKSNNNRCSLYLTDFGTCFLDDTSERLTETKIAIGSRMFLAPEYEIGRVENIDEKGDIFSLGKIIWCMINGNPNDLLPSNFGFIDENNLIKKFPNSPDIIVANYIISLCLNIDPHKRCDYTSLLKQLDCYLHPVAQSIDMKKLYKVNEFESKRKIIVQETLQKNRLLVNTFSLIYLKSLELLNSTYSDFELMIKLQNDYSKKSPSESEFCSTNVDNNADHYLYSTSFDNIYISINYHPASHGARFANITVEYIIHSSGVHKVFKISYNDSEQIISEFNGAISQFAENTMSHFLDEMIFDYIA